MTLDELAANYGTDKGASGHWYTRHYERIFGPIRETVESMCEVGIGSGASLRMWRDYFPCARVYGVDQDKKDEIGDRIHCYAIEQTDNGNLNHHLADKRLEIIVDDASHDEDKTFKTLEHLWPLLERRGWYVIEDMDPHRFPPRIGAWHGERPEQIRAFYILPNRDKGSLITFIQKQ